MRLTVVGLGKLGSPLAAVLASQGFDKYFTLAFLAYTENTGIIEYFGILPILIMKFSDSSGKILELSTGCLG